MKGRVQGVGFIGFRVSTLGPLKQLKIPKYSAQNPIFQGYIFWRVERGFRVGQGGFGICACLWVEGLGFAFQGWVAFVL